MPRARNPSFTLADIQELLTTALAPIKADNASLRSRIDSIEGRLGQQSKQISSVKTVALKGGAKAEVVPKFPFKSEGWDTFYTRANRKAVDKAKALTFIRDWTSPDKWREFVANHTTYNNKRERVFAVRRGLQQTAGVDYEKDFEEAVEEQITEVKTAEREGNAKSVRNDKQETMAAQLRAAWDDEKKEFDMSKLPQPPVSDVTKRKNAAKGVYDMAIEPNVANAIGWYLPARRYDIVQLRGYNEDPGIEKDTAGENYYIKSTKTLVFNTYKGSDEFPAFGSAEEEVEKKRLRGGLFVPRKQVYTIPEFFKGVVSDNYISKAVQILDDAVRADGEFLIANNAARSSTYSYLQLNRFRGKAYNNDGLRKGWEYISNKYFQKQARKKVSFFESHTRATVEAYYRD